MKCFDLSHALHPECEEYTCTLHTFSVPDRFNQYEAGPDDWYIMQEISLNMHVGTHIESPYHHRKDGMTISELKLDRLIAPCVCLDCAGFGHAERIPLAHIRAQAAERPLQDSVVFLRTGRDRFYHIPERAHDRPYLDIMAIDWLIEQRIACLGVDSTGIEVQGVAGQPNHQRLFSANIPLVENLLGLDRILYGAYLAVILPIPMAGLESCNVRIVAMDEEYLAMLTTRLSGLSKGRGGVGTTI